MLANILVVDDSAVMRQMVSHTLTEAGHQVTAAKDGQQALTIAGKQKFELVLTDVNMPVMDGLTLIKKLRALPQYQFTPLLTLTTESSAEKKSEGKAAGATGWIVKPFQPEQLLGVIQRVL